MSHSLLWIDLRQALRGQLRAPGFLLAALVSLALGLGVNLAVFSALRAGLAGAAPWKDPQQLITLGRRDITRYARLGDQLPVSYPRFQLWQSNQQACSAITCYSWSTQTLTGTEEPLNLQVGRMEPRFFEVLGVQAYLGRTFRPGDREGLLLSHAFWQRRMGGNPGVVGRTFTLGGHPHPILGVLPASFAWRGLDAFVPLALTPVEAAENDSNWLMVIGRMKPGTTLAQARESLGQLSSRLEAQVGSEKGISIAPRSLAEETVRGAADGQRLLAMVAVAVLLLACLNVTGLLLGRALARAGELGLRQALGAAPKMVFRPLLAEALVVAVPGLLLGIGFALLTRDLLTTFVPSSFRGAYHLGWPELGFGALLTLAVALVCAWIPARLLPRQNLSRLLGSTRSTETPSRRRVRHALLALQISLALAMLTGFALVEGSLRRMQSADLGFDRERPVVVGLRPPMDTEAERLRVGAEVRTLVERLRGTAGIQAVGSINRLPVLEGWSNATLRVQGFEGPAFVNHRVVGPGYFAAMGIPLLQGRDFRQEEVDREDHAVIVSQRFANHYLEGRNPVGAVVYDGADAYPIVGLVPDVAVDEIGQVRNLETAYFPAWTGGPGLSIVVRPAGDPRAVLPLVREEVRRVFPDLPLSQVRTMPDLLAAPLRPAQQQRTLMGLLAGLALALTLVGIFSVQSRNVAEQQRAFGIHASLGAAPRDILGLVLRQGLRLTAAGLGLGLAASLAMGAVLKNQLFGVQPFDPRFHLPAVLGLGAACILATLLPALRAARINPAVVLRGE